MARIPLNGQSYESRSVDANAQRTVNWYPEIDPSGKNQLILYPLPGYAQPGYADVDGHAGYGYSIPNGNPPRGILGVNNKVVIAAGTSVYIMTPTASGNYTTISYVGILTTASGNVAMASDGVNVMVLDGSSAGGCLVKLDSSSILSSDLNTTDADFPQGATTVAFMDGYFIVNDPNKTNASGITGGFFISGVYDGTSWAALDYDVANTRGDTIQAIVSLHGQLWLIGEVTTEPWYNSGNPLFPFEPINGSAISMGTPAPKSVVSTGESIIMISNTEFGGAQVVRSDGFNFAKVSNYAIDNKLQSQSGSDIAAATAFVMQYKGHTWYVLTVGTSFTYAYDLDQNLWFEWTYAGTTGIGPAGHYAYANGIHFIAPSTAAPSGDRVYLMELLDNIYSHNGAAITHMRQSPHFHMEERSVFCSTLHLKFEQGGYYTLFTDAQVMLQWSDDGGHTWSTEYWRTVPGYQAGVHNQPITWKRLGRFYSRIWRIKTTDPVRWTMIDAYMDADTGVDEVRK